MKTLAFDGRMGASGDMLLGALLDAGADIATLDPVADALEVSFRIDSVMRAGIEATAVTVTEPSTPDTALEGEGPDRTVGAVHDIIEDMAIPGDVRERAHETVDRLGEAEAAVHGESIDAIHFHEVGADDAIADIVGVHTLLADLGIEQVLATPIAAGGGTVEMAHGSYPVPGPAVVELIESTALTIRGGPVDAELLTPTGAAILATVASGVEYLPPMDIESSGYGAGTRDHPPHANVLRAIIGRTDRKYAREPITVLETNLDDATPEILGGLQSTLQEAGALDVSVIPLTMKKARPGHLVKVITRPESAEQVADRLARETGTLGIRASPTGHRWIADRSQTAVSIDVDGEQYEIAVKVATDRGGTTFDVSAEFDDAAAVAAATGRPIREICRLAEAAVRDDDHRPPDAG